LSQDSTINF